MNTDFEFEPDYIHQLPCIDCGFYYSKDDVVNCADSNLTRCEDCQIKHEWNCAACSAGYIFKVD